MAGGDGFEPSGIERIGFGPVTFFSKTDVLARLVWGDYIFVFCSHLLEEQFERLVFL